jgi:CubicO group peptidase (beta-lactamase class C family)
MNAYSFKSLWQWWLIVVLMLPVPGLTAEPQDLAEEIQQGQHKDMLAMIAVQSGKTLAESVSGKASTEFRTNGGDIRSATKSITSLLIGIAIDRGHIASVDTPIVNLMPDYADELQKDSRKAQMKIKDLLTMRSGLNCDDWKPDSPGHEDKMYETRDWIAFWAKTPMRDSPGELFSYCTGNVIALGHILENATGQSVPEYAKTMLFAPLGIEQAKWATWNHGKRTDTGGHLNISPDSLRKIGQLLLDRGRVGNRQIVSEKWIDAMTTEQTTIPNRAQRYGYLWWLDRTTNPALPQTRLWMAWGNGGNFLIVMPEIDAVVVFSGKRFNQPNALEPLVWLRDRIMPALNKRSDASTKVP